MSKPIQDSLHAVKQTQMEVNKLLSGPETNSNLVNLNSLFQQIINRLIFMGGILEPEAHQRPTKLQPMTRFMGKELKTEKTTAADLNPSEAEKQNYLAKVDKLYDQITFIQPSIILNSYTIPEDVMVLRGVAKRAGVDGYESKALTTAFIEEIQFAIEHKKEQAQVEKQIDASAKKGTEVTATQEMIDKSKYLQNQGVKPGDKVIQMPDNKFKVPKIVEV